MEGARRICRGRFQRPDHRGAHCEHAPPLQASPVDLLRYRGRQFVPLRVDLVVLNLVLLHRAKSVQADVECDKGRFHAHATQVYQQLRGEMQASRGRCHRALHVTVDSLVALRVGQRCVDVGR